MNDQQTAAAMRPYSVSQLNREVRILLESGLPVVWLEGEISNFSRPASGHWYFTLKDSQAQVRCAMFRNRNQLMRKQPANGDRVLIRARIGLYEARGEYQLLAESLEDAGAGQLRQRFEELKAKLDREGLFSPEHKQALPKFPKRIGLITSPTGAAVRDMINVLARRYPSAELILYPAAVQGDAAPSELMEAINTATLRDEVDVLIIGRGGGSAEDLWAFNDEGLAYVIHACPIPIVSAVGHEVDFSIADFVADERAATPSAAAELVSPDVAELAQQCRQLTQRLARSIKLLSSGREQHLMQLRRRILAQHPQRRLQQDSQRADDAERRLQRHMQQRLQHSQQRYLGIKNRLIAQSPTRKIVQFAAGVQQQQLQMQRSIMKIYEQRQHRLQLLARTLNTVSPLATLQRGYSITAKADSGKVLQTAADANIGDQLKVKLAKGTLACTVAAIETDSAA